MLNRHHPVGATTQQGIAFGSFFRAEPPGGGALSPEGRASGRVPSARGRSPAGLTQLSALWRRYKPFLGCSRGAGRSDVLILAMIDWELMPGFLHAVWLPETFDFLCSGSLKFSFANSHPAPFTPGLFYCFITVLKLPVLKDLIVAGFTLSLFPKPCALAVCSSLVTYKDPSGARRTCSPWHSSPKFLDE